MENAMKTEARTSVLAALTRSLAALLVLLLTPLITGNGALNAAVNRDLNNDGVVDSLDLGILMSDWGRTDLPASDLDANADVSAGDVENLLSGLSCTARWSSPHTWGGSKPVAGELVVINNQQCVLLDEDTPDLGGLRILGRLEFDRRDLNLTSAWIHIDGGGLTIGTLGAPYPYKAFITLTGGDTTENVAGHFGTRGLFVDHGTLELHGEVPAVLWTQLGDHAAAGAGSLQLKEPVTWQLGDEIVIAPTDFYGVAETELLALNSVTGNLLGINPAISAHRWGVPQYAGVTGIGLSPDPGFTPPALGTPTILDERAEVGNLTRRIVIQGADDALWSSQGFGAHMMVHGLASRVLVDGVEFRRAGQAGRMGRYPVHWHRLSYHHGTGALLGDAAGHVLRNSSIHGSMNRCVVLHATNGVRLENNICYDIRGHAIFLEDAVERRNLIENNLVLHVRDPDPALRLKNHEASGFQRGSSAFWLTNPDNEIRGNVAADARGNGFWLSFPETAIGLSTAVAIEPRFMHFGVFEDNRAYANDKVGLNIDWAVIDEVGNVAPLSYAATTNETAPWNYLTAERISLSRFTTFKNRQGMWNRVTNPDYIEFISADNLGTFFSGAGNDGLISRSLLVGTSLNNATTYENVPASFLAVGPAPPPQGFASYHSTFSMVDNTLFNFPFMDGIASGAFRTDDYYVRPVDKGFLRNSGNLLVTSHPGYRSRAAFPHYALAGALLDTIGLWGSAGRWWVYDEPFFTHGINCTEVAPLGIDNGQSCVGPYYGVRKFVLDQGNSRFEPYMAIEVERVDAAGTVLGTWSVADGTGQAPFPGMRHFAAHADGRYILRFPGSPMPDDVGMSIENLLTAGDTFLMAVQFNGVNPASVYTTTQYQYFNPGVETAPDSVFKQQYAAAPSLADVVASVGGTFWQDAANNLVWIKLRGGLQDPFIEDPNPFGDEALYGEMYLRLH